MNSVRLKQLQIEGCTKTSINLDAVLRHAQDECVAQDIMPGCSFTLCPG